MGNGMRGMRGMFTRIPGNLLEDSEECYYFNIPGNVPEDSGECWRRFWECSRGFQGMFEEIPGNVQEDSGEIPGNVQENSGECLRGFRGMFKKIRGNAQEDFGESKFRFVLWNIAYFSSNSAIKLRKNKGIFSALLITTYN